MNFLCANHLSLLSRNPSLWHLSSPKKEKSKVSLSLTTSMRSKTFSCGYLSKWKFKINCTQIRHGIVTFPLQISSCVYNCVSHSTIGKWLFSILWHWRDCFIGSIFYCNKKLTCQILSVGVYGHFILGKWTMPFVEFPKEKVHDPKRLRTIGRKSNEKQS